MANDKKIVKLIVNYDSNENKDEPKRSRNTQWYLRVLKGRPGPSCQLVCKIVIGKKDTNFQVFQYRPVQLSYPKLENEVNILDIKDNPALSTCFLVKSETTKVTKALRNE